MSFGCTQTYVHHPHTYTFNTFFFWSFQLWRKHINRYQPPVFSWYELWIRHIVGFHLILPKLLHIPFHTIDGRTVEPHLGCNKHMPNKKACNFHDKHMDLHAILKKITYVLPWCPCSNITSCPYFSLTTPHWDLANVPVRPATCSSNAGEAVFKSTPTEFTQDMVAPRNSWRKTGLFCLVEKRCLKVVRGFLKIWGLFSGEILPCKYDIVWIHDTRCEILWIVIFMQVHQTFLGNLMIFCLILSHPGRGQQVGRTSLQQQF